MNYYDEYFQGVRPNTPCRTCIHRTGGTEPVDPNRPCRGKKVYCLKIKCHVSSSRCRPYDPSKDYAYNLRACGLFED